MSPTGRSPVAATAQVELNTFSFDARAAEPPADGPRRAGGGGAGMPGQHTAAVFGFDGYCYKGISGGSFISLLGDMGDTLECRFTYQGTSKLLICRFHERC